MREPLLRPCPFCGGRAILLNLLETQYVGAIHEKSCTMRPDTWLLSAKPIKKQIKAWNQRPKMEVYKLTNYY